jgi:hypothetical protein
VPYLHLCWAEIPLLFTTFSIGYNVKITTGGKGGLTVIIDKFLTRKGWRVVAHCMLAGSGVAFLYLLSTMILESSHYGYHLNLPVIALAMFLALWAVALGVMLARFELMDRRG